jgi:membrane-associated phospholipid phosphatase
MSGALSYLVKRPHWFLLLLYPVVAFCFFYFKEFNTTPTYIMEWPGVDRAIPFVSWMIVPYFFWYIAVAFPFLWLGVRDPSGFTRYCWFIYGAMMSTYVLYLLFPNGQNLRPDLGGLHGWDIEAVQWLYGYDAPRNCNPSLHVIDSMAVWFAMARDAYWRRRPWLQVLLAFVCLSIIVSTVFVKQHSIIDIFGGLAWSGVWWMIVYWRRPQTPQNSIR